MILSFESSLDGRFRDADDSGCDELATAVSPCDDTADCDASSESTEFCLDRRLLGTERKVGAAPSFPRGSTGLDTL